MVRKENRLYNTVLIILSIQVITWIRQDSNTVSIKTLQLRNRFSERTPINQYNRIMTYDEIINAVENGAKFTINFQKRTCRVNGKIVMSEEDKPKDTPYLTHAVVLFAIEQRYKAYKHSVPSERSESHRRYYFKALPEKELSDEDMMYGERREVARCKLELYILIQLLRGNLAWENRWGRWFWKSENDKDLIILRDWIEPNKGGA